MKKLGIITTLLALALAFTLTSCGFNAGMETLSKDQITSDWVDGYWTGTVISTVNDGEPKSSTWDHTYWSATELKALYDAKGSVSIGSSGADVNCVVQANLARSKIYIKQTVKVTILGSTTTTVTEYQLTRDSNQEN